VLSISDANLADAPALLALRTAVARGMAQDHGEGPWSASPDLARIVQQLHATRVLVARREGQIVGMVRLTTVAQAAIDSSSFTPVANALYVLGLAVAPEARRASVGRRLMEASKDIAREWPATALWLDAYEHAAGAGRFYSNCGFQARGTAVHEGMTLRFYEWLPGTGGSHG
jgi:GNAT superfamily N-acetyltransferase